MRFKKLRVVVMIALIIFILAVANTIAFGLFKEKFSAPDTKQQSSVKTVAVNNTSVNTNKNVVTTNTQTGQTNTVTQTNTQNPSTTTTTIIQPRRTRAS